MSTNGHIMSFIFNLYIVKSSKTLPSHVVPLVSFLILEKKIQKTQMFSVPSTCVVVVSQGSSKRSALETDKDMCPLYWSPLSYKAKNRLCFGSL